MIQGSERITHLTFHRWWIEAHRTSKAAMVRVRVLGAVTAKRNHQPQMATALLGPQTVQLHPRKAGNHQFSFVLLCLSTRGGQVDPLSR